MQFSSISKVDSLITTFRQLQFEEMYLIGQLKPLKFFVAFVNDSNKSL